MFRRKAEYYKSCAEITLYLFGKIIESGDLSLIDKKGKGKDAERSFHWNNIFNEYLELSKNENQHHILELMKYVSFMKIKIDLIYKCIQSISKNYNKELVDQLKKLGIRTKINRVTSHEDIRKVLTEVKKINISLKEKEKELENLTKNENKEKGFENILVDLSKFQGYRLDDKEISVKEFCSILNRYNDYHKSLKKRNGK